MSKIGQMKFPKWEKTTYQHKIGKTPAGSQRYRCYFCKHSYTPEKKQHGYGDSFRQRAIRLYVDGIGLRRTGRQLGVHHQGVANWAKDNAEQLPPAPVPDEVKTAEFYELSDGKTDTFSVEADNAELRHYLARLARSSRCFSRCPYAVRLFVYYFNQRQLHQRRFSSISFTHPISHSPILNVWEASKSHDIMASYCNP